MEISTAVGLERLGTVTGYKLEAGYFNEETPNLPQMVAILGEANSANQATLSLLKRQITSAEEAGKIYGYGSPIHQIMRILRPNGSDGIGGIPTIVFPQKSDVAATETTFVWTITGNALKNVVHSFVIGGRENLDFKTYSYSIAKNDTPTQIAAKIANAVNAVLSCPFTVSNALGVLTFVSKWKGLTSAESKISVNSNGDLAGLTYAETSQTLGTGVVDISGALEQFGTDWITSVINPYGESTLDILEQFNGAPTEQPTGRFEGITFKPFISFFGSTLSDKNDLIAITDNADRVTQVTNVLCPAPNSDAYPWEAAANVVAIFARTMQDTPEIDVTDKSYPDMPVPLSGVIGEMSVYNNRDLLVKNGCSTVILDKGSYKIKDLVTTYHPEGEEPLQFSYARNLNLDFNFKFAYAILEERKLRGRVIVADDQVTDSLKAIKPKEWKADIFELIDRMAVRALITDTQFSKNSVQIQRSPTNPNRFNTNLRYRRTGTVKITSTDVQAGF